MGTTKNYYSTHQCSRTLLKSFENSSIEEISSKEVDELRSGSVVMETTEMITTHPMYGDFFLPKTHQFRKTPNNEEKLGKTLQIPQMKK